MKIKTLLTAALLCAPAFPVALAADAGGTNIDMKLSRIPSWPPKITQGQTWMVMTTSKDQGKDVRTIWQIILTGVNNKGNPVGRAISADQSSDVYFYYDKAEDTAWLDFPLKSPTFASCRFTRNGFDDGMMGGTWLYFKQDMDNGSPLGTCVASPTEVAGTSSGSTSSSGGTGTGSAATGSTIASRAATTTATTATSSKLTWPLRPQPGQRYTIQMPQFGQITVSLTGTDDLGTKGKARFSDGAEVDAYFYYAEKDKTTWLDLVDDTSLLYCAFEGGSVSGSNLTGKAYYRKDRSDKTVDAESLGTCKGKLN